MSPALTQPEELVALGAFVGAQVLVVCFSVIRANSYRERALLLHAAAALLGVLTVQSLSGSHPFFSEAVMLLLLAMAGFQLAELMNHAGAVRLPMRWLVGTCIALPGLAAASVVAPWLLMPGIAAWLAAAGVLLLRAWPQSRPWIWWLGPGIGALVGAAVVLAGGRSRLQPDELVLTVAGLLAVWAACTYLAAGWRGRIFGETKVRINARTTVDPLTGLSTPLVLQERIAFARTLMQRYGHPSVLLLVHIENLPRIAHEFGLEVAEAALLTAANRVREALREGDVAARLAHSRIGVLAEGLPVAEGSATLASRILVAGGKEPLPAAPAEFLQFRIVLAPVLQSDLAPKQLLARLATRLEQELREAGGRRIVALGADDLN